MDPRDLEDLARRVAAAVRAAPHGKPLSYANAIDLVCEQGAPPGDAAAVIAHGIDLGLFQADAGGLRPC